MRQRTDPLPIIVPKLDVSANKLYVNCVECGGRRSAVWRDKPNRVAVCIGCIQKGFEAMIEKYRTAKHEEKLRKLAEKKLQKRHR